MKNLQFIKLLICLLILVFPKAVLAQSTNNLNQFTTIVNPVRISFYTKDPGANLTSQYSEIKKRNLPATWLLTYDVMLNSGINIAIKLMDSSQELGLFLEVTPDFAKDSDVIYNKTDSWHRANSVFLSGYTQQERIRLIDKAFEKFKKNYGYYPVSVGAWWIDSYSLDYMKRKYNIIANLTVADQFSTDGYQVWGQYFSTPFYPSKIHAGIPASSLDNKLDIVTLQWASRDPLNGYGRTDESRYSTQDYFTKNLTEDYFKKLFELYGLRQSNKFGHITIGLEGDLSPDVYQGIFARQLDIIKTKKDERFIDVVTMRDFSSWYRNNFPMLSPVQIILSDDLLGKKIISIWYQTPYFRINIIYDHDTKKTQVRDFRTYHDNFQEPYYVSPNRDLNLSIILPSIIDSAGNPDEIWQIWVKELQDINSSDEILKLNFKNNNQIKLTPTGIEISGDIQQPPKLLIDSPLLDIKKSTMGLDVMSKLHWNFPEEGLIFRSLTQEATFFLKQRKVVLAEGLIILSLSGMIFFLSKKKLYYKIFTAGITFLAVLGVISWYLFNSRLYFVPQAQLDALNRLKLMPGKKVVVYDQVCLQCRWHTLYMPAIFANKRGFVKNVSKKDIIYNSSIFNAKTRLKAREELNKLHADYIYLVKFEDYVERAPFSPGDLNLEEVYSNANVTIWRIKKN